MFSTRVIEILLTAVLVLLVGFCGALIFYQPVHIDEALTYRHFVAQGWKIAVSTYPFPNNHVFFSLLGTVAVKLIPDPFIAMRSVSLVSTIISGWLIFRILRFDCSRPWALVGVLLWAGTMATLFYAAQARGYAVQSTLLLLAVFSAIKIIGKEELTHRGGKNLYWFVMSVSVSLGLFTIPSFLIPALGLAVLFVSGMKSTQGRLPWLKMVGWAGFTVLLTSVLYGPLLNYAGLESITDNQWIHERQWQNLPQGAFVSFMEDLAAYLGIMFPVAVLVAIPNSTVPWYKRYSLHIFVVAALFYMLVFRSVPFPRTFSYLSAIAALSLTWNLAAAKGRHQAVFFGATVMAVFATVHASLKLIPDEQNPSHVALMLNQDERVREMNVVYTDGWNGVGAMLDFYGWYYHSGPKVISIYSTNFWKEFYERDGHYFMGASEIKNQCSEVARKGTTSIYDCH